MKYSHLYIPKEFDFQILLIPGFKHCFSEIKFLSYNTGINDNVLTGLTELIESIKELELFIQENNNNRSVTTLSTVSHHNAFQAYLVLFLQATTFNLNVTPRIFTQKTRSSVPRAIWIKIQTTTYLYARHTNTLQFHLNSLTKFIFNNQTSKFPLIKFTQC
ncbi:hypothetical protein C1645_512075 [Glomus cerebriforme]|uniref:Uncharacterized protein n=1 Tax=Glomus cerebriforme TaxID=658196 RepID=A0A397TDN8_9GLOM|nr:hypothetical protein C1645_512075 [Glomus cerebriforme]